MDTLLEKLRKGKVDVYNLIEDFVTFIIQQLCKSPNTGKDVLRAVRHFFRSERISLDPRLVIECASIPKSYRVTKSDFVLYTVFFPTVARVEEELETEFYSLEGCRSGCKSSINSFEGRDNKDKSWQQRK